MEVVRILGFLEGDIVCSPSFCMERACGSVRVCNCGSRIWISIGTIVREGMELKDRALMLPESLAPSLREQLSRARAWWLKDQAEGRSGVALPDTLERKYPRAGHSGRGSGFAQHTHSTDPRSGVVRRHHLDQTFRAPSKRA